MKVRLRFRCTLKGEQIQAYRVPRAKKQGFDSAVLVVACSGYVRAEV